MKLGMFMMPFHSTGRSYPEMYAEDIEAVVLADRCGFDEVWVGEHYSASVEPISNSLQFMSALIPLTTNIKLCPGVLNLPQHHPVKIAADVAMFDNMANGRFVMGVGPGGLGSDLEMFGTLDQNRNRMMCESMDIVEKLWSTDAPYDITGEYWTVKLAKSIHPDLGIGQLPRPLQNPFPRVGISAMSPFSDTAKLAGEKGWDLISAHFNAPWVIRSQWDVYALAAQAAGHAVEPSRWRVARSILVTGTDAEAEQYLADPDNTIAAYYNYMVTLLRRTGRGRIRALLAEPDMAEDDVSLETCLESMVIAGSPETVGAKLRAFHDEVGGFGELLMAFHEWDQPAIWKRSYELLATTVLPMLDTVHDRG
jgi:alkanesulfonate monooxygenase SsuD/methylene tetrahydromethanopterin reductase-like flavin-dependent oxidoreductase (luciferase family)